jgi:hypothetical protein
VKTREGRFVQRRLSLHVVPYTYRVVPTVTNPSSRSDMTRSTMMATIKEMDRAMKRPTDHRRSGREIHSFVSFEDGGRPAAV